MLRAFVFGLGFGAAVQAWRGWPATAPVQADSVALVFCVGLVAAFYAGKRFRRSGSATATAVATAAATASAVNSQTVQFLIASGPGGAAPAGVSFPTDAAPWLDHTPRAEVTPDDLEGMDLADLLESHPDHDTTN